MSSISLFNFSKFISTNSKIVNATEKYEKKLAEFKLSYKWLEGKHVERNLRTTLVNEVDLEKAGLILVGIELNTHKHLSAFKQNMLHHPDVGIAS
ncbi:hypothetical protein J1N35_024940 [Gossypium stocksii]|uniref:Uncharacterized protein n=1 Tax=Gossypium stocksii TaxID=47602 RepID=A0A9D3V5A8_9ROSI|nr:hypothetical protein J1N35_024940 [Gossypium stocksii]